MSLTTCRGCGQPLTAEATLCGVCGVRVNGDGESRAPVTDVITPTAPAAAGTTEAAPVAATAPEAAPRVIRLKKGHIAALAAVVAFILIAAGVAGAMGAPEPKPAGELVGQLPFGPDGGTATFDDGKGEIEVPEGALEGDEVIEVRRTVIRERVRAASPTGTQLTFPPGALVMYTFGPVLIVLNRPVIITLQLPVLNQAGLIFVNVNGNLRFLPGDLAGQTITVQLTSFNLAQPGAIVVG